MSTTNVQHNFRTAATIRGDTEPLTKMGDYDLTAKEFMMHAPCYNDYVRVIDLKPKKGSDSINVKNDNGDFEAVKQIIEQYIIGCNKALSMVVLYEKFHSQIHF